jgi:hypothetical protein
VPSLKKITPDFLPELIETMLRRLDPQMSRERWRRAFTCCASSDEGDAGYALTDGGKIVGMQGMIFSRRTIAGQYARFCNLHCWFVEPEYRPKSLLLMKPVLDLKEHTITDLSASARVLDISKRLGFTFPKARVGKIKFESFITSRPLSGSISNKLPVIFRPVNLCQTKPNNQAIRIAMKKDGMEIPKVDIDIAN